MNFEANPKYTPDEVKEIFRLAMTIEDIFFEGQDFSTVLDALLVLVSSAGRMQTVMDKEKFLDFIHTKTAVWWGFQDQMDEDER
jgi:hypothetical protein